MPLTADQLHCFSTSRKWREFRAMFSSTESALDAYVTASQGVDGSPTATHELEWRYIFHSRESKRKQVFALLLLPLGHIQTHHAEFRFKTQHCLSKRDARRLMFGRALGSSAYHLCFVGLIATGVGMMIAIVSQVFSGLNRKMSLFVVGLAIVFFALLAASAKTRSLGLFGPIRLIAKDAFDLLSIRRVGAAPRRGSSVTFGKK